MPMGRTEQFSPRLLLIWFIALGCTSATRAQDVSAANGLRLKTTCGVLSVAPIAENAFRVRCAPQLDESPDNLVLIHREEYIPLSIDRTSIGISLKTSELTVTYQRATGALRFFDSHGQPLLEEIPGARRVSPSTIQGQPTLIAEDRFRSPGGEHLFGSGQFQDGFLDVRDLPRRLTQVNSQISIPFLISSKGYGLLWHNLGRTDLNAADNQLKLDPDGAAVTTESTITTS